jgi:hypothetical protein
MKAKEGEGVREEKAGGKMRMEAIEKEREQEEEQGST